MSIKDFIDKQASLSVDTVASATDAALAVITKEAVMPQLSGLEELQAQLASATQEKVELSTAKTELEASLASAIAAKAESDSVIASLQAELATFKLETETSARKSQLASVLPEDQVESVLLSTTSLDAGAFGVVYSALKAKADNEAASFAEVGFSGAEASAIDPLDRIIAAQNSKSKGNK